MDGEVDFGQEPTKASFKVTADGLDLKQLPEEWGLPKEIEGKRRVVVDHQAAGTGIKPVACHGCGRKIGVPPFVRIERNMQRNYENRAEDSREAGERGDGKQDRKDRCDGVIERIHAAFRAGRWNVHLFEQCSSRRTR